MASPLSKDLIAGAIGESGSILATLAPVSLAKAEESGVKFASAVGASSISALRAMTTAQIFEAAAKPGTPRFGIAIDGYFFLESPLTTFAAGKQAHVPLLAGWNSEEQNGRSVLGREAATPENLAAAVNRLYPEHGAEVMKEYAATTIEAASQAATDLASDRFIGYGTWKWIDLAAKTGGKPVYRYYYARPRPAMTPQMGNATAGLAGGVVRAEGPAATPRPVPKGAVHSAEIEYALGNLATNKVYAWTPDDYKVSALMQQYFANFIKTGNPNGANLPEWPKAIGGDTTQFMRIDVDAHAETEEHRGRYLVLDSLTR
jgi:para-nitrobenzyl esterase